MPPDPEAAPHAPDRRGGGNREGGAVAGAVAVSSTNQPGGDDGQSAADSRPSLTNRADPESDAHSPSTADSLSEEAETIPPILASFREGFSDLVNLAISTVPGERLRQECTREVRGGDGSLKSRLTQGVLKEFLRWYIEQENSQLVFEGPDGTEAMAPVPNSYSDEYGRNHYGRLKDLEREAVRESSELHTVMLSLTASSTDENGMQRPLGDHLQGIQDSWNPSVRRELQRVMTDAGFGRYDPAIDYDLASGMAWLFDEEPPKWWEYATVVEPHGGGGEATGYGHFHVAVFASHPVEEEMFHSVIEKHVEKCEYAGREAHDVSAADPDDRPISVNAVDPDSDSEGEEIGNLGSYLSEYIGGFSGELEERPMHELLFQATAWSQGRQRVRYSNGAGALARQGRERRARNGETEIHVPEPGWDVKAIENTASGERHPPAQNGSDYMVTILDGPPPD